MKNKPIHTANFHYSRHRGRFRRLILTLVWAIPMSLSIAWLCDSNASSDARFAAAQTAAKERLVHGAEVAQQKLRNGDDSYFQTRAYPPNTTLDAIRGASGLQFGSSPNAGMKCHKLGIAKQSVCEASHHQEQFGLVPQRALLMYTADRLHTITYVYKLTDEARIVNHLTTRFGHPNATNQESKLGYKKPLNAWAGQSNQVTVMKRQGQIMVALSSLLEHKATSALMQETQCREMCLSEGTSVKDFKVTDGRGYCSCDAD